MQNLKSAAARYREYSAQIKREIHQETGDVMTSYPPRYKGMHSDEELLADWAAKVIESLPDGAELPEGMEIMQCEDAWIVYSGAYGSRTVAKCESRAVAALLIWARALVSEVS